MSLRQIKKVLETQKKQAEERDSDEHSSEEEEETKVPTKQTKKTTNAFELLDLEELDNDEEDEAPQAKPKKKKKNKKKAKAKQEVREAKEEEDIDEILSSINNGASTGISADTAEKKEGNTVVEQERLFRIDPKMLDPEAEIRRVFGAKAAGSGNQRTHQNVPRNAKKSTKKVYLAKPKDDWPPMFPGISMEIIENKSGQNNVNYFKIVWSSSYHELQQHFYECVETADPYSFQDLLMINPYHVDSTLQLAQVCIQTGDYAMAGDLVERCLYSFECAWHNRFAPHGPVNCYLEFSIPENRSFFLAILKHIQMLGRRGSIRTALEFGKLLISLDPADPLYMRGVLDYYCNRGKEYAFLLTLFERAQVDNTPFSIYPNFCYSAALAKFALEQQKTTKSSSSANTTTTTEPDPKTNHTIGSNPYPLASSKYLLYNAMTLFPMVLLPLLNKAGIGYREVLREETAESFFNTLQDNLSPLLKKTVTLFVEKNNTLWKAPEVVQWLKEVMTEVLKQVDKKGKEYAGMCAAGDKAIQEWNAMNTRMGSVPLLLSEHAETASPLPPELFVHNPNHVPAPQPNQVPLANNPLALFIQTLMPWVNIPPPT